jgi:hypothetical protein
MSESEILDITDATTICRSPSVVAAEEDGELIMMNLDQSRYFSLDAIGAVIWGHLEQPLSFAALVDRLADEYEASRSTIVADRLA